METPIIDKIHRVKSFFLSSYAPGNITAFDNGTLLMTTEEIHAKLQTLFPNSALSGDVVFEWLSKNGFKLSDQQGQFDFKWMISAKNVSCMNAGYEFPQTK